MTTKKDLTEFIRENSALTAKDARTLTNSLFERFDIEEKINDPYTRQRILTSLKTGTHCVETDHPSKTYTIGIIEKEPTVDHENNMTVWLPVEISLINDFTEDETTISPDEFLNKYSIITQ